MSHLAERNTLMIDAYLKNLDHVAGEIERRWGVGRLPLLVAPEMAARFEAQRQLVNEAVWEKRTVEAVRDSTEAMIRAWVALDAEASRRGAETLRPEYWETVTDDGTCVVIARENASAWHSMQQGRSAVVFTLEEIGKLLNSQTLLKQAKQTFPGGKVTGVRNRPGGDLLDDDIPF